MESLTNDIKYSEARHLPIVTAFAQKLGIIEEVDRLIDGQMELSPGRVVLGLILDTLSGRTPLFRLHEFFAHHDTELLLGQDIPAKKFSDDNVGRVLDRIFAVGTQQILGAISLNAVKMFDLELKAVHFDTTSRNLYGDYAQYGEDNPLSPFAITFGFSKDKRPDLKQFVMSLLSVDKGIPIFFQCEDGNASDKKLNGHILNLIAKKMAQLSADEFTYIADSAAITPENLDLMAEHELHFISRLPATYKACGQVISEAVRQDRWEEIGVLAETAPSRNRKPAAYKVAESQVRLYDRAYRAIVVHSDAHDQRRLKRLAKVTAADRQKMQKHLATLEKQVFFCQPDAQQAARAKVAGDFHRLEVEIVAQPVYAAGRPRKDGTKPIKATRYVLAGTIVPEAAKVALLQQEAGCFVLLTSRPAEALNAAEILKLYKDQHYIEQNFAFLKDPVIINEIFLKKPERIEALGLIFVLALMIWRLIERTMRQTLQENQDKVPGWDRKPTDKPTAFMMSTKFSSMGILKIGGIRRFNHPINDTQLKYLEILGLTMDIFLKPEVVMMN